MTEPTKPRGRPRGITPRVVYSVPLRPDQSERLRALAWEWDAPITHLIREAVDQFLGADRPRPDRLRP